VPLRAIDPAATPGRPGQRFVKSLLKLLHMHRDHEPTPSPGPLPRRDGAWFSASRSHLHWSLPGDHPLNSKQPPAVPSLRERVMGRGKGLGEYTAISSEESNL